MWDGGTDRPPWEWSPSPERPGALTHFRYSSSVILRQKVSSTRRSSLGSMRPVLFTSMRLRARTTALMFLEICTESRWGEVRRPGLKTNGHEQRERCGRRWQNTVQSPQPWLLQWRVKVEDAVRLWNAVKAVLPVTGLGTFLNPFRWKAVSLKHSPPCKPQAAAALCPALVPSSAPENASSYSSQPRADVPTGSLWNHD